MTDSIKRAIAETDRRRNRQVLFNEKHSITRGHRQTHQDLIDGVYDAAQMQAAQEEARYEAMSEKQVAREIKALEKKMVEHAKNLEFEQAARVRAPAHGAQEAGVWSGGRTGMKVLFVCTGTSAVPRPPRACSRTSSARRGSLRPSRSSPPAPDYHAGEAPDLRAQDHARKRGYDLSALRARQVRRRDFEEFDWIVAMDRGHLAILEDNCPEPHRAKLRMLVKGRTCPTPTMAARRASSGCST